jgi:hypothetical protein
MATVSQTQKDKEAERAVQLALLDLGYGRSTIISHSHLHLSFIVESMRGIYDTVVEDFPPDFGKALSKREREDKKLYMSTLIYGEIDFDSFGKFIRWVNPSSLTHS